MSAIKPQKKKSFGLLAAFAAYILLIAAASMADYDLGSVSHAISIVGMGAMLAVTLWSFSVEVSGIWIVVAMALSLYLSWPYTAAWRLQHAPYLTTQAERESADFIRTIDAVKKAFQQPAK